MRNMKIIIIDDDVTRRNLIKDLLPDYVTGVVCGYGNSATKAISPDAENNVPDMVLMNADDRNGLGLYTFDWMKTKATDPRIKDIPVILLTEDEFSDRCLDFLEIDDVSFYEGEVDEDRLYSAIIEVLDELDFKPEPIVPSYSDEKSFDRIRGISVKPQGETAENKRSIVIDMSSKAANLEAALERGRKKTEQIRELLEAASDYKGKNKAASTPKKPTSFLGKYEQQIETNKQVVKKQEEKPIKKNVDPLLDGLDEMDDSLFVSTDDNDDEIPDEFKTDSERVKDAARDIRNDIRRKMRLMEEKLKADPTNAVAAHTKNLNEVGKASAQQPSGKLKIVVVDDTESDRKLCEIFLGNRYEVVLIDSGMKAIDYFVKNTADLVLLDTYMPNLGGVQILSSIRWQNNGKNVPVIYMVDRRYPVQMQSLEGEKVVGILQKPLSAGGLAIVVDGYFRRNKR